MNDADSRTLIASDLSSNILVEAAAGTGKTTSIVGRMVNLIATGTCKIDTLAAATFTRKAAAELRERFHSTMRIEAESPDRNETEKSNLRSACDRIEYAFVGTFHSFCSLILRERPIECGVDPGFREIDESEDAYLREQAWQTFLKGLYSKEDNRLDQIYELGLKTDDLKKCYNRFVQFPDVDEWPHEAPPAIDLKNIKKQILEYVEDMRSISKTFPVERGKDRLMTRYENIVRASDNTDSRVDGQFFDLLELFDTAPGEVQKCWGSGTSEDKKTAKRERDRFKWVREEIAEPTLSWWYQHRYEFVIKLLSQAQEIYEKTRHASGGLDFQDLLLRSAKTLKNQPALRSYFQRRFSHILVDEFQDTDPIQAEILAYLTSHNHAEIDWRKCVPAPGRLFLVGDPKQSIYRFRRADIVTYQQVKAIFAQSGGKIVSLAKNFRSTEVVRSWINPIFGTLFGETDGKYSPAAVDMEQGRVDASKGETYGIEKLTLPDTLSQEEIVAYEAEQIAKHIAGLISRKSTIPRTQKELDQGASDMVQPGDILIVTRNKKHLGVYADALDRYGVANEVTGSNTFQNISELQTILTCLHAIDDAKNPIPYVSILRSDLFGFGDQDLYELKRCGGSFSYSAPIPGAMADELRSRFEDVTKRFSQYRHWLRNMPFTTAFSKIATDLGLLAKCSMHRNGNMVAGGFLKAVEWLRAQSWDFDSANDVVSYLEEMIENAETDSCSILPQSGTAVRIMNVHKAKGLEAPIVFLANTFGRYNNRKPHFHVDRSGDLTRGYLAITKPKGNPKHGHSSPIATPANWKYFQEEEQQFEDSEDTRLLYVSCTRAACKIIVSVSPGKERSSFWQPLHQYVSGLQEIRTSMPASNSMETSTSEPSITLEALNSQIDNKWTSLTKPTYSVVAAKSIAMKESGQPTWHASGEYGASWGSALHALLEIKMKHDDADLVSFARQIAQQFELGTDRVSELVASVHSVTASEIWARSKHATKLYTEVPFESTKISNGVPTITRGVIDLCFEETNGWVIVDYKTDDITPANLMEATNFYATQLRSYAEFWTTTTGTKVTESGIYFTKLSNYQIVKSA